MQYFATAEGGMYLKGGIVVANDIVNVTRWLFAADRMWLALDYSCNELLARLGAKHAL
jgi:hypothetical protein